MRLPAIIMHVNNFPHRNKHPSPIDIEINMQQNNFQAGNESPIPNSMLHNTMSIHNLRPNPTNMHQINLQQNNLHLWK